MKNQQNEIRKMDSYGDKSSSVNNKSLEYTPLIICGESCNVSGCTYTCQKEFGHSGRHLCQPRFS